MLYVSPLCYHWSVYPTLTPTECRFYREMSLITTTFQVHKIVLVESRFSINVNKVINISDSHNTTIRGLASSHSYRSETEI